MSEETAAAPELTAEDRARLRKINRKVSGSGAKAEPVKETKVSDVFPVGKGYSVGGVDYEIGPLTFRDQRDIEHEYFGLQDFFTELDAGRVTAMLFLVWLSFRKSNSELSLDGMLAFVADSGLDLSALANEAIMRTGLMKSDPNAPRGEEEAPNP